MTTYVIVDEEAGIALAETQNRMEAHFLADQLCGPVFDNGIGFYRDASVYSSDTAYQHTDSHP